MFTKKGINPLSNVSCMLNHRIHHVWCFVPRCLVTESLTFSCLLALQREYVFSWMGLFNLFNAFWSFVRSIKNCNYYCIASLCVLWLALIVVKQDIVMICFILYLTKNNRNNIFPIFQFELNTKGLHRLGLDEMTLT